MPEFGTRSQQEVNECHTDLQMILDEAIKDCPVDFGVSEGGRSFKDQLKYFLTGKSRIDPRNDEQRQKAKHLREPSEAFDIYIYVPEKRDLAYDKSHLCFVAGWIIRVAWELYERGEIDHKLRWGGNWDGDGVIISDQSFDDLPHFELLNV